MHHINPLGTNMTKRRKKKSRRTVHMYGLVQDCSNSSALTMELLQSCNKPSMLSLIARFMGPKWGPSGANRTQVGPTLAPWTLLSGMGPAVGSGRMLIKQLDGAIAQIAKTIGSTSIRYQWDMEVLGRCLIDDDPMVFAMLEDNLPNKIFFWWLCQWISACSI